MAEPLLLRLPQGRAQVTRKWSPQGPLYPFLSGLPQSTSQALQQMDLERINTGQNPLTEGETRLAGQAAATGNSVIGEPDQPWYRDLASDVQTLATSIPKLPFNLIKEAQQLPQVGPEIDKAITRANGNPLQALGNIAQAPGARLIPGSFIASQFGTGGKGIGGLTEHPLFTGLDLLPAAETIARATPTVKMAEEVAARNAAELGTLPERVRPLSTLATRKASVIEQPVPGLTPEGTSRMAQTLEPNALGRVTQAIGDRVADTGVGQLAKQISGRNSQELMRITNRRQADIHSWIEDPSLAPEGLTRTAAEQAQARIADLNKYSSITPNRVAELHKGLTTDTLSGLNLTPLETEYANAYKQGAHELGQAAVDEGHLSSIGFKHGEELYDVPTGKRIMDARRRVDLAQAGQYLRDSIKNPEWADAQTLHEHLVKMLDDPELNIGQKVNLAGGYLTALESQGVDVGFLRPMLKNSTTKLRGVMKRDLPGFTKEINEGAIKIPESSPIITPSSDTNGALNRLSNTKLMGGHKFNDRALADVTNRLNKAERQAVPARFHELVLDKADSAIQAKIREEYADHPDLDQFLADAAARSYGQLPDTFLPEVRKLQREYRNSWMELADQGVSPTFVHRSAADSTKSTILYPRIHDYTPTPSSIRARMWDAAPSQLDPMMALTHQAMEFLIQKGSRLAVDDYLSNLARPGRELIAELDSTIRNTAQANPLKDYQTHVREALARDGWKPFDPDSFINGTPSKSNISLSDQLFMPREVVDNLSRLRPQPSAISQTLGGPMKLFRTSVLPLSPRWHLNNIIGGAIMTLATSKNPLTIFQYAREAAQMAKKGGLSHLTEEGVGRGILDLAQPGGKTAMEGQWMRYLDLEKNPQQLFHFAGGATLRRVLKESWEKTGAKAIEKSYDFNQVVDDFYRSLSYLEGKGSALKKGMTREEAVKQGIVRARDVLQKWDTLTPLERSSMRVVFPFYAWTKTLLGYVAQYPATHPWRTNIMANIARAEQADLASGIPQRLRHLLFLGQPDVNGNVQGINLGGANPFSDVANYASLVGFMAGGQGDLSAITSNVNPVLGTTLQAMGLDPTRGQADLYPDLYMDPLSGQLALRHDTPLPLAAINNLVPQSRALTGLMGWNKDFAEMAKRNPDAASRMLASSLGVPVVHREVNVPTEIAKNEVRLHQNFTDTKNQALKSGDLGLMDQYPGLAAFKLRAEKLRASQDGQRFTADPNVKGGSMPGAAELALGALKQK